MARKRRSKAGPSSPAGGDPARRAQASPKPDAAPGTETGSDSQRQAGGPTPSGRPDWWYLHLWQIQPIRDVLLIAGVVLLLQMGYALRIVTIPILVAMLLAYLFEPLVERVTRRRWVSRQGATLMIIFVAAGVIVIPLAIGIGFAAVQGTQLARSLSSNIGLVNQAAQKWEDPEAVESIMARLPNDGWRTIAEYYVELRTDAASIPGAILEPGLSEPQTAPPPTRDPPGAAQADPAASPESAAPNGDPDTAGESTAAEADSVTVAEQLRQERLRDAKSAEFELVRAVSSWIESHTADIGQQALATGRGAVGLALGTASSLGVFLFQGFLTAFFFFFFSTGWGKVQEFWESLIPERRKGMVIDLLRKMDAVIAGFVRGRLLIGVILAIFFTMAYWLIGVPAPLLLGPITGLLCLVPYLGTISVPVAIISIWLSPSPWFAFQTTWWWMVFAPIVVYNLGQFFDDYVLTPQIQGKSTDMDVPSILFATIAGGALAGIYGLLLAIPVAACIKILLHEIFWPKFRRWATGQEKDFLPIDRT